MNPNYELVGTVVSLHHYPVKSMTGEPLDQVKVGWHGLAGDRRFAFVRSGNRTGLPWLSAREFPGLIRYRAYFMDSANPDVSTLMIRTPDDQEFLAESLEIRAHIEAAYGEEVFPLSLWRGTYDSMPVSLISQQSISAISESIGQPLEISRFRPNILINALSTKPFPEDRWVGELIILGEQPDAVRIRICRRDPRCMIVNLDPKTARQNSEVLREIVQQRRNLLGVYGNPERTGNIKVGDPVYLARK